MNGRVERNGGEYRRLRLMGWGYSIGIALIVVVLVFTLWLQSIQIVDNGMAPVLRQGDIVLFDKLAKYASTPARGDAYAFYNEAGGVSIGRVVGLSGERVQIIDGMVYINGLLLDESRYIATPGGALEEITLGQGEFLLLPDDRTAALLEADAVTIPFSRLIGRAAMRVSPWGRACFFSA